jgi:hypothetical protein
MLKPLCLALTASLLPLAGQSHLPPVRAWSGASEALVAGPQDPWRTPAEHLDLMDTPNYDDTIAYLRKLTKASPWLKLIPFGSSAQGRTLYLVLATKAKAFTPAALKASGKPTLMAQGGIHAGEIDGKDAGLMLLRDIAVHHKDSLLDQAHFLFVPVFNVDGHERVSPFNRPNQRGPIHMGWRTTAQNLNLNRDYLKADAPEMRAMLGLYRRWAPDLVLDLHVTDGIDYQYDITFGYNGFDGGFSYSPRIAQWLEQFYRPQLMDALTKAGHLPRGLIFAINDRDLEDGLGEGTASARFSTGYGDLRKTPTVLVENHSLKPYRQRVLGTYVLLEASLAALGQHGHGLQTAIRADQDARPAQLPLVADAPGGATTETRFQGIAYETYASPASGGAEVRWTGLAKTYEHLKVVHTQPDLQVSRPKAYWVPVTKPEVIDRLKLHGVRLETLTAATTRTVEMYRLVAPVASALPSEGHHSLAVQVSKSLREETFPAGSVRVSTDQPLGDLVMLLLEPQSPESLLAWGFFPEILERTEYMEGYAIAPLAEQLLSEHPDLKAEFEAKLAADPAFAGNPQARLAWFYARSPYYDQRYLLYPVGRE